MPATATLTTDDLMRLRCGDRFAAVTEPSIELVVEHRELGRGRNTFRGLEIPSTAIAMTATQDGRRAELGAYHDVDRDGPEGEWVYFERALADGSGSHGWIDSNSRKLLQVG